MQFQIIAYDGKDEDALTRRMAAREAHLDGVQTLIKEGTFINGGAILNEDGQMIGSTLYVEFPNREALDEWLASDPYTTGGVWKEVTVLPIKLVSLS